MFDEADTTVKNHACYYRYFNLLNITTSLSGITIEELENKFE